MILFYLGLLSEVNLIKWKKLNFINALNWIHFVVLTKVCCEQKVRINDRLHTVINYSDSINAWKLIHLINLRMSKRVLSTFTSAISDQFQMVGIGYEIWCDPISAENRDGSFDKLWLTVTEDQLVPTKWPPTSVYFDI